MRPAAIDPQARRLLDHLTVAAAALDQVIADTYDYLAGTLDETALRDTLQRAGTVAGLATRAAAPDRGGDGGPGRGTLHGSEHVR